MSEVDPDDLPSMPKKSSGPAKDASEMYQKVFLPQNLYLQP